MPYGDRGCNPRGSISQGPGEFSMTLGDNRMNLLVVGHVEWVTFLRLSGDPRPSAILHVREEFEEPAGGGGVAAVELARLAGRATLITALGDDANAARSRALLEAAGVRVCAATRAAPQRRVTTLLGAGGERTILVHGQAQEPSGADPLAYDTLLAGAHGVYFCKGDVATLAAARAARVLVATARVLPVLQRANGLSLDVLVRSGNDAAERFAPGDLSPPPAVEVVTEGAAGGYYRLADGTGGRYAAHPLPGPPRDTYGAGDCFAAALTWGLAEGQPLETALSGAAARGAAAVCRRGAGLDPTPLSPIE
jgi:ribokinase